MLRICFIGGYALLTILLILFIAMKTIAVVGSGGLGEFASDLDQKFSQPKFISTTCISLFVFISFWVLALFKLTQKAPEWERKWVKTLIIGCSIMFTFFIALATLAAGAIYLKGFPKTVAEKIAGLISSPVIMELSFFSMGFTLLLAFNIFRRIKEGDEFVYLEIPDSPETKKNSNSDKTDQ